MLDQWRKRWKRAGNISTQAFIYNQVRKGTWHSKLGLLGCTAGIARNLWGATKGKQFTKADTAQTYPVRTSTILIYAMTGTITSTYEVRLKRNGTEPAVCSTYTTWMNGLTHSFLQHSSNIYDWWWLTALIVWFFLQVVLYTLSSLSRRAMSR